ncbi:hypothetical protein [Paenibacillus sp. HJGM_3]|uniref:hypothetical protein n=1 Tax=Paenibacillus sp. HJGM_3 TaxID=3379816 RepID=UPI00385F237F
MTWKSIAIWMGLSLLIAVTHWIQVRRAPMREKAAWVVILLLSFLLAAALMLDPELPGPTQLVNKVFGRLGTLIQ